MRKTSITLMLAALTACSAEADPLPSQVDLKAAYCISVIQDDVAALSTPDLSLPDAAKQLVAAAREKAESNLRHLQRYLIPRIQYLDTGAILAAAQQGKEDSALISKGHLGEACITSCLPRRQEAKAWKACMIKCMESDSTYARLKTCSDLSFLPF